MHPAYSVIVFTTASGAGYGLLTLAACLAMLGAIEPDTWTGLAVLADALSLVTLGLLSSMFHLGRPERAWRAFSQWKTSWLSREGVSAILTYGPVLLFGYGWIVAGSFAFPWNLAALLTALGALATVWCTGMIYASLKTVRRWSDPLVAPLYVILGLATGGVVLNTILNTFLQSNDTARYLSIAFLVMGLTGKLLYWQRSDHAERTLTSESATGLGFIGEVKPLEPPHTQPNYVMREMGYEVGRKHASRLRRLSIITAFLIPLVATGLTLGENGTTAIAWSWLAVVSCAVGILIERWLFFAEAQHVVTLYYGAQTA